MERHINYTIIGGIFFAVIVCMVIFILWIGRIGVDESKYRTYYVYTDKEVSGIGPDTPVKYKGITIGSVTKIGFDKDKLGMVKIDLAINASIPIRKGSSVMIDSQGLAGLSYLSLKQSDNPEFIDDKDLRVLEFKQNFLGRIASNADEVTKELLIVLKNVKELTDAKNVQNVSNIIKSLDSLTEGLAKTKDNITALSKNSNMLLLNLNHKIENGDYDLKKILNPVVMELEMSLKSMDRVFQKGSNLLDKFDSDPYNTIFGEKK
ncbi:glycoside hydrolase family 43 [Helicobacter sp. 12S02232-10]|uniref:MlaD family protein n=1 Tax=Helicobacter sp. 12S02232-10 TaxID=1476197 RepID=UPI000BA6AC9E|nr:MlaD family protein [Helicobacter sp. 12S02232-10]PAF49487.1 glycoside hydrolase family 43 [Helicobacter sp. 12S02232-10]